MADVTIADLAAATALAAADLIELEQGESPSNASVKATLAQLVEFVAEELPDSEVSAAANLADNRLIRGDGGAKGVQSSGVALSDSDEISGYRGNVNRQTGTSYTLLLADSGKIIELANASAVTLNLPNNLPAGFCCTVVQDGAGQVTLAPASGATLKNRQSHTKLAGNGALGVLYVSSNTTPPGNTAAYRFGGDTAA